MVTAALIRDVCVVMCGVLTTFESGARADRRGSGNDRGPEVSRDDQQREQAAQYFYQHAIRLNRDTGTIKRVG